MLDRVGAFFSLLIDVMFTSATAKRVIGVRLDPHHALLIAMLSIPFGHVLIYNAVTPAPMQCGFFMIGLGNGLGLMEATALLLPVHRENPENVAFWVSVVHAVSGFGALIAPQLVSLTTPHIGRAQLISFCSCLAIAAMCVVLPHYIDANPIKCPNEPKPKHKTAAGGALSSSSSSSFATTASHHHGHRHHHHPLTKTKYNDTASLLTPETRNQLVFAQRARWWRDCVTALVYIYLALTLGLEFVLPSYLSPFAEVSGVASNYVGNLVTSGFWMAFVGTRFVVVLLETLIPIQHDLLLWLFTAVSTTCGVVWAINPNSEWSLWVAAIGIGAMLAPAFPSAVVVLTEARTVLKHKYVLLAFCFAYAGMVGCNGFLHWLLSGVGSVEALPCGVVGMLVASWIVISLVVFLLKCAKPRCLQKNVAVFVGSAVSTETWNEKLPDQKTVMDSSRKTHHEPPLCDQKAISDHI